MLIDIVALRPLDTQCSGRWETTKTNGVCSRQGQAWLWLGWIMWLFIVQAPRLRDLLGASLAIVYSSIKRRISGVAPYKCSSRPYF